MIPNKFKGIRCTLVGPSFRSLPLVSLFASVPFLLFRFSLLPSPSCPRFRETPLCSSCAYGGGGDVCQFRGKFRLFRMVEHVLQVTIDYEKRLAGSQYVPKFSFRRRMLRDDGGPNRLFLMYLFCDQANAIRFLREIGLLRRTMLCNTYGRDMTCCADSSVPERFLHITRPILTNLRLDVRLVFFCDLLPP